MSWFLTIAGFAALIVLHEFGHFAVAKAVGMRVERFALFFPPLLVKVRRGETEYGIGAIPLGGYVRISGMNPHEELAPEVEPRAYYRQPPWKRIVVIAAGPAMNVLVAFLILWILFWVNGLAKPTTFQWEFSDPDIRSVRPGRAAGGSDWIGLRRNEGYTVAGINQLPLLPGILVALAFLMAIGSAWWREGR